MSHGPPGEGVSSLFSASLLTETPPPNQAHMVPPLTHLHFKENPLHMSQIHLHFNSPRRAGREQGILPRSSPHPHRGGWRACVPFRDRKQLQLSHQSLRARS